MLPDKVGNDLDNETSLVKPSFFVFSMEAFQFSKFYENKSKHDKRNFKSGLSVASKIKNIRNVLERWT